MKPLVLLSLLCALTTVAAAEPVEVVVPVPPGPVVIVIVPAYGAQPASEGIVAPPAVFAPPAATPQRRLRQKTKAARRPSGAIGVNPIGWIMETYGASAWLALGERRALRIDGTLFSWKTGYESYEAELGMPLYLVRTFEGPFIEPGLSLRRTRGAPFMSDLEFDEFGSANAPRQRHLRGPMLLVGWHWRLGERAHLATAFGFAFLDETSSRSGERESTTNGYLRLGVTF